MQGTKDRDRLKPPQSGVARYKRRAPNKRLASHQACLADFIRQWKPQIQEQARKYGMTCRQLDLQAQAIFSALADYCGMYVRMPARYLANVISDGRLKNQFESEHSRGHYNPQRRIKAEAKSMAVDEQCPAQCRPIYGYLATDFYGHELTSGYGEIILRLKRNFALQARTTFILGDSLNDPAPCLKLVGAKQEMEAAAHLLARTRKEKWSEFLEPARLQDKRKVIDALVQHIVETDNHRYIEAQYHGGITLDDIEQVTMCENSNKVHQQMVKEAGLALHLCDEHASQ